MKQLIESFPAQLKEALDIASNANLHSAKNTINNVLITGLGGSGIGGTIVSELIAQDCSVPVFVNKDYIIPGFVGEDTLVIVSSYSGNTEETLMAFEQAQQKGAEIAVITSGGKALEWAETNRLNHIVVPGGNPPRSMLAYSFTQLLSLLNQYGLIGSGFRSEINAFIDGLNQQEVIDESLTLANHLKGTIPVIYSIDGYEGIAVRFRQQLNENSKMLCWHAVIPEMNHNELVGWTNGTQQMAVVVFRNEDDFDRNQKRVEINKSIIEQYTPNIYEVWSKGASKLERILYHIHFGDWVSMHLSELNNVDVMAIDAIDRLKSELAKF